MQEKIPLAVVWLINGIGAIFGFSYTQQTLLENLQILKEIFAIISFFLAIVISIYKLIQYRKIKSLQKQEKQTKTKE